MNTGFKEEPQWFTGVVEDINDPSEMGRIRVRCYGYHNPEKELELGGIPTEALPWAHVMMPINSASMSGIGQSATGVLQGSWVIGFFRDGDAMQDPFVIGTLPSMAGSQPAITKGFADPDGIYPRTDRLAQSDLSPASREVYGISQPYILKNDLRQENVETAVPPRVTTIQPDKEESYYERGTWNNRELDDIIAPEYPKNHVNETESGHILEVDDTPSFERLSRFHKSGTYEEIVANGDRTLTVFGDDYEVVIQNRNILIKGNLNLTVEGNMRTLVKKDYILEVEGDKTEYVKGNRKSKIGLNELIEVDQQRSINVAKDSTSRIGGSHKDDVVGDRTINITGNYSSLVNLNSKTVTNGDASYTTSGVTANGTFTISSEGNLTLVAGRPSENPSTITIDATDKIDMDAVSDIDIACPADVDINGGTINLN